jgi:nicotinamidase-related amidase
MVSEPTRDPVTDHLLTPQNCLLAIIDYQPTQVRSVTSMDHDQLLTNVSRVARTAVAYGVPIVLSTVNVSSGTNGPTVSPLAEVLSGIDAIDRTTVNSWEDIGFRHAVESTGRKKLVMAALWTEVCLTFPLLDAIRDGYEAYPVVDAVGGTSREAHDAGLARLVQAGAQPVSWAQFVCELQRDWARTATVDVFRQILFGSADAEPATSARQPTEVSLGAL